MENEVGIRAEDRPVIIGHYRMGLSAFEIALLMGYTEWQVDSWIKEYLAKKSGKRI